MFSRIKYPFLLAGFLICIHPFSQLQASGFLDVAYDNHPIANPNAVLQDLVSPEEQEEILKQLAKEQITEKMADMPKLPSPATDAIKAKKKENFTKILRERMHRPHASKESSLRRYDASGRPAGTTLKQSPAQRAFGIK